jgi:hypothetical protein
MVPPKRRRYIAVPEQETPATRDPEEDEGNQPAWPTRSRTHGRRRQGSDHPHRSARTAAHAGVAGRGQTTHIAAPGQRPEPPSPRPKEPRSGPSGPDRARATAVARAPCASPALRTHAAGTPGPPARHRRRCRAAYGRRRGGPPPKPPRESREA